MIRRGEVRWVTLPLPDAKPRPVLIVSSDAFNASRIGTVLAVVISSRIALAQAPGNVRLTATESGLSRDGVVVVSHLVTLDRAWVGTACGCVKPRRMDEVARGMQLATGTAGTD